MLVLWAFSLTTPSLAQSQVIFDSLAGGPSVSGVLLSHDPFEVSSSTENTSLPPNGSELISQVAQRLNLTGTSRHLARLDLRFGSIGSLNHPASYDNIIRIFDVGADSLPGNLLWSGVVTGITFTTGSASNRVFSATLFPDIDIPDSIFLSSAEENIVYPILTPISSFGIAWRTGGGPFTGTTGLYAVQSTATSLWSQDSRFDAFPGSVIEARLTAIPAPSAAAILCFFALPRRRRA